ncbi:MAG: nucleotide exchange factor GrpE [Thaumarchaeota archaeon]|nr:nucleotide exchange factor GrpE [Nitrososphaerota archaeon]
MSSGSPNNVGVTKPREEKTTGPSIPPLAEELEKLLAEALQKADSYRSQLLYLQADLENLHKKMKRDMDQIVKLANERIILKILDLGDDLERTLEASEKHPENANVIGGVKMILKNLDDTIRAEGVEPIEAVGKKFSPDMHEAVSFINGEDSDDNTVTKELRKGYTMHGKVIRTSMVEVSRPQAR